MEKNIAELKLASMGNSIDSLTAEQKNISKAGRREPK